MDTALGSGTTPERSPGTQRDGHRGTVIALGEPLVRLSSPGHRRLEQASWLDLSVGGAELNTLIVLSQFGYATTLVTRLPRSPLGRLIARHARSYSVELAAEWDEGRRAGSYFIEYGAPPRPTEVLYDRSGSAASELHPRQFDWDALAARASAVHVTGITCALGNGPHLAARALLEAGRNQSALTSFDLNHRSRLWSDAQAAAAFRDLLPLVDIAFVSPHDLALVLGREGPAGELAPALARRFGVSVLVVRETVHPAPGQVEVTVRVTGDQTAVSPPYRAHVIDPFGAGDVAAGAFLASWIADRSAPAAADMAARAYAHMNTVPGDSWAGSSLELAPDYHGGRSVLR